MFRKGTYTVRLDRIVDGRRQGDAVTFNNIKAKNPRDAEKQILSSLRATARPRR